jgi:glycosyltransferase involved in cell wall biosynthesis
MGADPLVVAELRRKGCVLKNIEKYNHEELQELLSSASLSFVPMPNVDLYELRGNLKIKLAMAAGCITVASDLQMHRRLIKSGINGYLFRDYEDFKKTLNKISSELSGSIKRIGKASNIEIVNKYTRKSHAEKICNFIFKINEQV